MDVFPQIQSFLCLVSLYPHKEIPTVMTLCSYLEKQININKQETNKPNT